MSFRMGKKNLTKLVVAGIILVVMFSLIPLNNNVDALGAGGDITNTAPTVATGPTGTVATKTNEALESEYFTGTVEDVNGEGDIEFVNLSTDYSGRGPWSNDTRSGVSISAEPGSGPGIDTDGITVWDATADDGILNYKGRITWQAGDTTGTYTQTITVRDEAASDTGTEETAITGFSSVTYVVVDHSNVTIGDGTNWNFGSAAPGATNVNSTGYLRAYNSGYTTITLEISFTNFTNAGAFQNISIYTKNMNFRANSTTDAINSTTLTPWGNATNGTADGSVVSQRLSLGEGEYMYFEYKILAIPSPIPDLTFTSTITATYS